MLKLNENELVQLNQFIARHERCFDEQYNLTIHLRFTGTGIGIKIEAICDCCGECIDLSDYGCW